MTPRRVQEGDNDAVEIALTSEQQARLEKIARHEGMSAEEMARGAVLGLFERDEQIRSGIRRGIEQLDRGEFISHEEVKNRIETRLQRE